MSRKHDAIVIGSGLGGLSAAAKLARSGLDVHLLERHNQPGGYASTFQRQGYEFEISLHELSGIGTPGNRGNLWPILEDLGISQRVAFKPIPYLYRTIAEGMDLRIPHGREAALEAFVQAFPHEKRGFTRLINKFYSIWQEKENLSSHNAPSPFKAVVSYPNVAHAATVTLDTLLYRRLKDPLARLAFGQLWGFFGLPPSRLSLLYFAGGVTSYLRYGACYPEGKSQAISNAFVEVIEESSGRISLGNGAKKILVKDGGVAGVLTDRDDHLEAKTIIVNANPISTCMELIGREHLPDSFLSRLFTAKPGTSIFNVYLGLSSSIEELGIEDHEIFINGTTDMEQQYRSTLGLELPESLILTAYNVVDRDFSPPGTSVVMLSTLANGEAWNGVAPGDYHGLKQRFAEAMTGLATSHFPRLKENIDVEVTSSPITNMRYTGNIGGAIYGFENTPDQNPAFRFEPEGPLEGMWFAGAWTKPGGGFEPCITSGYYAANQVLETLGMTESIKDMVM